MGATKPIFRFAIGVLLVGGLTGCSNLNRFEPAADSRPETSKVVEISVRPNSVEQVVLGELYKQGLERKGRAATVNMDRLGIENNVDGLLQSKTDMVVVCAGRVLHHLEPDLAEKLEKEYSSNKEEDINSGNRRETVYQAVMGAIGDNINGADPSNALGCSSEDSAIPQHIIPVYRSAVINREERGVLNVISGTITTEDLEKMVEKSRNGQAPADVVREYLDEQGVSFD